MTETPELSIYEKAFEKSDKTDAILVVDGKKLHVSRALLSHHSDYFNTLFNSEFKEKSMEEIPIEDVNFEYFATVLSLVDKKPFEITWKNAENLLKLADRFLLSNAKIQVELFIKTTSEFTRHEKLMLADKYNLENLLEHALGSYNSKESFQDFLHANCRQFSDSLKAKVFDRLFACHDPFDFSHISSVLNTLYSPMIRKLDFLKHFSITTSTLFSINGNNSHFFVVLVKLLNK